MEKNIIYGMKNITLHNFFQPLILAYFERKKKISFLRDLLLLLIMSTFFQHLHSNILDLFEPTSCFCFPKIIKVCCSNKYLFFIPSSKIIGSTFLPFLIYFYTLFYVMGTCVVFFYY